MALKRAVGGGILVMRIVCLCGNELKARSSCALCTIVNSRNYILNRNGNFANFFFYVCNGKKIKELFASTLNGITASVRCVSSMIVVLNAKLAQLFAKKTVRTEELANHNT